MSKPDESARSTNARITDELYIVIDDNGVLYPLQDELSARQFSTFKSAEDYAQTLAECHIDRQFEIMGLYKIVAFKASTKTTKYTWNFDSRSWDPDRSQS
jgi:hypothetical protein